MNRLTTRCTKPEALPKRLRPLFWEYDFTTLSWNADRDLIIARVLTAGDWEAIQWLRGQVGDNALRVWIEEHGGRGLDARRLRFWELILKLPSRKVGQWLRSEERKIWENRRRREGEGR